MKSIKLTIDAWLDKEFPPPSSRPTRQTVRNMLKRGELKGKKVGSHWYIVSEISTGDAECDEILRAIS